MTAEEQECPLTQLPPQQCGCWRHRGGPAPGEEPIETVGRPHRPGELIASAEYRIERPLPVTITLDGPHDRPLVIEDDATGHRIALTPDEAQALADDLYAMAEEAREDAQWRIAALINQIDLHRPLGPDGTHGDRHTATCGCEGKP